MAEFTTPNGVRVQFDNNHIVLRDGDPPLLEFDAEDRLVGVHFDGYEIRPVGSSPTPDQFDEASHE
jgi:hypothetical protein